VRDHRGGGRSSARETVSRVVGGAFAKTLLNHEGIKITAYVSQVGEIKLAKDPSTINLSTYQENIMRCPDQVISRQMEELVAELKDKGDSVGGVITCLIDNVPVGLGEPVFDKLHADLAKAMLSINAVKGFEYGGGFEMAAMNGSQANDAFKVSENRIATSTNFSGGIQAGISNGERIYFNVAFKPVATISLDQQTVNNKNEEITLAAKGRHDPCVVPRAVVIVESMAALVMADHLLRSKVNKY
jgi:chorismate synthase